MRCRQRVSLREALAVVVISMEGESIARAKFRDASDEKKHWVMGARDFAGFLQDRAIDERFAKRFS